MLRWVGGYRFSNDLGGDKYIFFKYFRKCTANSGGGGGGFSARSL